MYTPLGAFYQGENALVQLAFKKEACISLQVVLFLTFWFHNNNLCFPSLDKILLKSELWTFSLMGARLKLGPE